MGVVEQALRRTCPEHLLEAGAASLKECREVRSDAFPRYEFLVALKKTRVGSKM